MIDGVKLLAATALIAVIGEISVYKNGREMAAWSGLVPVQYHLVGNRHYSASVSEGTAIYGRY